MPKFQTLGIYYTFETSCFIKASLDVEYPDDISKPLIIEECYNISDLSIFQIPELIKKYKKDWNKYYSFNESWVNFIDVCQNHEPTLQETIKDYWISSLDFAENNKHEIKVLEDLISSLKKSDRLLLMNKSFTIKPYYNECLLVVANGLHDSLCGQPDINWMFY